MGRFYIKKDIKVVVRNMFYMEKGIMIGVVFKYFIDNFFIVFSGVRFGV